MSENRESVVKGIVKYSISTWVNLIVGFLYVVISTRVLDPSDYGLIVLFLSMSSLLMSIIAFGMDGALIRYYNTPPLGFTKPQLLYKNITITLLVGVGGGIICTFFFGSYLSTVIFNTDSIWIIGLVFIYAIALLLLRFLNISFRMSFRAKQYNVQNILMNCLTRVLIICAALIMSNYKFILVFLTLGTVVLLSYYLFVQRMEFIPLNQDNKIDYSLSLSPNYYRFALFSAPTYIIVFLNTFLSQQIVNMKMDSFSLGIFASTGLFSSILVALQGGFSTYWSAYIYKNYEDEKEKITSMHNYIVMFSIIMASLLVVFRDVIYQFIGMSYHESKFFYSLLLILPVLNFIRETTDKGIAIANKNEISMIINIVSVVLNLGLSYLLIDGFGLKGAAFANAISAIILFALSTIYGQKYYSSIKSAQKTTIGVAIIVTILTVPSIIYNIYFIIAAVLLLCILSYFLYKNEYLFAYNYLKSNIKLYLRNR